ncbi:unnamed protein product [Prunus armeniaca]
MAHIKDGELNAVRSTDEYGAQGGCRDREIDDEVFSGKRGGQQMSSAHVGF